MHQTNNETGGLPSAVFLPLIQSAGNRDAHERKP